MVTTTNTTILSTLSNRLDSFQANIQVQEVEDNTQQEDTQTQEDIQTPEDTQLLEESHNIMEDNIMATTMTSTTSPRTQSLAKTEAR